MSTDIIIIISAIALCLWASVCPRLLQSEQQEEIAGWAAQLVIDGKCKCFEEAMHKLRSHFDYSYKGV